MSLGRVRQILLIATILGIHEWGKQLLERQQPQQQQQQRQQQQQCNNKQNKETKKFLKSFCLNLAKIAFL